MKSICYVSTIQSKVSSSELYEAFVSFKKKNIKNNISGVLLHKNGNFLQIIEGKKETIDALFSKIKIDKRHKHIITLIDFPIPHRLFEEYKTSFSIIDSPEEFKMLIEYTNWLKHADSSCAKKAIKVLEAFIKK